MSGRARECPEQVNRLVSDIISSEYQVSGRTRTDSDGHGPGFNIIRRRLYNCVRRYGVRTDTDNQWSPKPVSPPTPTVRTARVSDRMPSVALGSARDSRTPGRARWCPDGRGLPKVLVRTAAGQCRTDPVRTRLDGRPDGPCRVRTGKCGQCPNGQTMPAVRSDSVGRDVRSVSGRTRTTATRSSERTDDARQVSDRTASV